MVRYLRFVTLSACFLLVVGLTTTMTARPARANLPDPQFTAATATLCTGYSGCARVGRSNAGYASASHHMYWRMFSGHNCTNYAAYRMVHSGMPNTRPWTGSGNATNWGVAMSRITNGTPAVGAIAWWRAYHRPAGSAGHVAYVEQVVNSNTIVVSQDSWGGDFSWKQITRTGGQWPSGFVHFNDHTLRNTGRPVVSGHARVGSTLSATRGHWSKTGTTVHYRWRANGVFIPGSTARTMVLHAAQLGKRMTVRVVARKSGYSAAARVSARTSAVKRGVITNPTSPTVTGEPQVGRTLTAIPGAWKPANATLTYAWRADDVAIPGANEPTLTIGPELLGKVIAVKVTGRKAGYRTATAIAADTKPVAPGALGLTEPPTVSGQTRPGQTLSLDRASPRPADARVSLQWLRDGVPVAGATRATYRLQTTDLGHRLRAQISATRHGYRKLVVRTPSTGLVRALPRMASTAQPVRKTQRLALKVTAPGLTTVNGKVGVRWRGALLTVISIRNGVGSGTVRVAPGNRRLRLHFRGSRTLSMLTTWQRVLTP